LKGVAWGLCNPLATGLIFLIFPALSRQQKQLKFMAAEVITTDDLREFKLELLEDFKKLLSEQKGISSKKWVRSDEVKDILKISDGTLQNFRVNGTLPFSKIGGVLYYDLKDINSILEQNKIS
jgi:hypothetical protein